jgi:RluA family pseudouridine synthase
MTSKAEAYNSSKVRIVAPYPLTRKMMVKGDSEGKQLSVFLHSRFPYLSEDVWKDRISKGWIRINGNIAEAEHILRANQQIDHFNPHIVEPSVPDEVRVVSETDDYLIAHKPAPMPMHQGGRYCKNTLISILEERGAGKLRMIHRLDSVTSGLVILAKNKEFALQLHHAFSSNKVKKWYYALVEGVSEADKIEIKAPIKRKNGFVFECGENLQGGKSSHTVIEVVQRFKNTMLVRCEPVSGRTHQIRLHLRHWGHPIIDDPIYGPGGDDSGKRLQHCSVHLQSSYLSIPELHIEAELDVPESWIGD